MVAAAERMRLAREFGTSRYGRCIPTQSEARIRSASILLYRKSLSACSAAASIKAANAHGPQLGESGGAAMNGPFVLTDVECDPRAAFLLIAATHYDQFQRGEETLDYAFQSVAGWLDRMFPPECCPTCGLAPCGNPPFCAECRRADESSGALAPTKP